MADNRSRSPSPRSRSPKRGDGSPRRRDDSRSPPRRRERERRSRSPSPRSDSNQGNCLHVSGLSSRTTEQEIEDAFSRIGKVSSVKLITDPRTNDSRGFAFVTMETSALADAAIDKLDGRDLDERKLSVQRSKRGQPRDSTPGKYLGFSKGSGRSGYGGSRYGDYGRPRYDDRRYDDRGYGGRDDRGYGRDDRGYGRDDRYDDRRYDDRGYGGRDRSPGHRRSRSR